MALGKYYKSYTIIFSIFLGFYCIGHLFSGLILFPITITFNPSEFKHVSSCSNNRKCLRLLTFLKVIFWLIPIIILDMFHFMYIAFSGFGFFNAKDRQKSQIRFYDIKSYQLAVLIPQMIMFIPLLVIHIIFYNTEYLQENDNGILHSRKYLDGYFIGILCTLFVCNIVKIFSYSG